MTKVPNILDHLDAMLENATGVLDKFTLATAREMVAEFIRTKHHPPSWPLNLDEWEIAYGAHEKPDGDGWWMMISGEAAMFVRRRKARAEQVTMTEEK